MQFEQKLTMQNQKMQTESAKNAIQGIVQKHETKVQSMMDKHTANIEKAVIKADSTEIN